MKRTTVILAIAASSWVLSACQTAPHQFNGKSGYEVLERSANTATLSYTLSGRPSQDERRLQASCKQVLGNSKTYNIQILSMNEIPNPTAEQEQYGRQLGNSRTQISLSNTPDLYNSENPGAREALDARPTTMRVIRYTCS
ncbi:MULTISPECIES: hypothetical protein [unclassified Acinetobacter]|uniref:hypothetical protein n=1 Tax=unclassified Acinetobacter TaxID=196816 RepID=UPI001C24E38B|nr:MULTISPECIES: hypothetical protein [unclassified Acinetobacter]